MKNRLLAIICICSMSHGLTFGGTTNYVGTWSNKKSDFSKVAFGLRQDGHGFYFAAIGSTVLRWTNSMNGIDLRIANKGRVINQSLQYDSLKDQFASIEGKSVQVFFRESTNEPPDLESEHQAKLEKEYEEQLRSLPVTSISAYDDFITKVHSLTNVTSGMQMLYLTSANKKTMVIKKINSLSSITLITLEAGTIPMGAGATEQSAKPDGDYKTNIIVAENQIAKLRAWLEVKGAKCDVVYCVFRGPWGIEGYRQMCEVSMRNNNTLFMDAVTNIVKDAFAPFEFPVTGRIKFPTEWALQNP